MKYTEIILFTLVLLFAFVVKSEDTFVLGNANVFDTSPTINQMSIPLGFSQHVVTTFSQVDAGHPSGYGTEIVSRFFFFTLSLDLKKKQKRLFKNKTKQNKQNDPKDIHRRNIPVRFVNQS